MRRIARTSVRYMTIASLCSIALVSGTAYGTPADPAPETAHGTIHTLTINGENYTVEVMDGVDLTHVIQLGQPDGTTREARVSAVDGVPVN